MAGNDTVNNSIPAELRKLGGMAPLAETREQAIADSVKNSAGLQQAYPDIDWKESLIKPVINMVFDLQVRVQSWSCKPHMWKGSIILTA